MNGIIPAKLHLGDKTLLSDTIPAGTVEIGDWAYAYCSSLKWLAIPTSVRSIGKEVFIGCPALRHIFVYDTTGFNAADLPTNKDSAIYQIASLNALALLSFTAPLPALICPDTAEKASPEIWDKECLKYLDIPDETGFDPFLAGGEEDYGDHEDQLKLYVRERQLQKARITYTRLISETTAGLCISTEVREKYLGFLYSDPESLTLLNDIDSHFTQTAEIYAKAGLLTAEALPHILDRLQPDRIKIRSALIGNAQGSVLNNLAI